MSSRVYTDVTPAEALQDTRTLNNNSINDAARIALMVQTVGTWYKALKAGVTKGEAVSAQNANQTLSRPSPALASYSPTSLMTVLAVLSMDRFLSASAPQHNVMTQTLSSPKQQSKASFDHKRDSA